MTSETRGKLKNRDSGLGGFFNPPDENKVITSQPTTTDKPFQKNNTEILVNSKTTERCCIFNVGCIGMGPDEDRDAQKPRSPSATITECSDSAFFDGISVTTPSPRPSLGQVNIVNKSFKIHSEERDTLGKASPKERSRKNTNKRVSFLADEVTSTLPESSSPQVTKEGDELEYILQCIEESKKHYQQSSSYSLPGKQIELDNFCGAFLKHKLGGRLLIPGTTIYLYVPPEALEISDEPQLVYIYRRPSTETPTLSTDKKETWATPLIECGPPGLKFVKPVFLSMPYKFQVDVSQLEVSGYRNKNNNWEGLGDSNNAVIVPQKNEVTFILYHFCKHGCTVQPASSGDSKKWMKVFASVEELDDVRCRIEALVCDITDTEHLPEANNDGEIRTSSEILVNNFGGSMNVAVNGVDENWKLCEVSFKQISCDDLWTYQTPPRATFDAQLRDGADIDNRPCCANVDIYQDDNAQPSVSLQAKSRRDAEPTQRNSRDKIRKTIDELFLETKFKPFPHFIRQDRYHQICVTLDNAVDSKGWRQLALKMGFEHNDTLEWIEKLSQRGGSNHCPSSIVLDFFFKDTTEENVLHKMRCLSDCLMRTNNGLAQRYVDEEIADHMAQGRSRGSRTFHRAQSESGASGESHAEASRQQTGKWKRFMRSTSLVLRDSLNQLLSRNASQEVQNNVGDTGGASNDTSLPQNSDILSEEGLTNLGFREGHTESTEESVSHEGERKACYDSGMGDSRPNSCKSKNNIDDILLEVPEGSSDIQSEEGITNHGFREDHTAPDDEQPFPSSRTNEAEAFSEHNQSKRKIEDKRSDEPSSTERKVSNDIPFEEGFIHSGRCKECTASDGEQTLSSSADDPESYNEHTQRESSIDSSPLEKPARSKDISSVEGLIHHEFCIEQIASTFEQTSFHSEEDSALCSDFDQNIKSNSNIDSLEVPTGPTERKVSNDSGMGDSRPTSCVSADMPLEPIMDMDI